MEKQTVIAKVRGELYFTDLGKERIKRHQESWIAESGGDMFLQEFGAHWDQLFTDYGQVLFEEHFRAIGLDTLMKPQFKVVDSRRGSWVMEAALTMLGSVGSVYIVLKGISEIPKIADGLEELKSRLSAELSDIFQKEVKERIEPNLGNVDNSAKFSTPSENIIGCNFSIDTRPLRSLTQDKLLKHKLNLSAGVSRRIFVLENLGKDNLSDLNIGLFKSEQQRHQWSFQDAYTKTIPLLSPKQSISIDLADFKDKSSNPFEINDTTPAYLDCWIQDQHGILLFNFLIDE